MIGERFSDLKREDDNMSKAKNAKVSNKRSVEINGVEFTVSMTKLRNGEPIMIAFLRGQRGAVHRARTEDAMMAKLAEIANVVSVATESVSDEDVENSEEFVIEADEGVELADSFDIELDDVEQSVELA